MAVPFRNEMFRVDVRVIVVVLSEVADELKPEARDRVGPVDELKLFVGDEDAPGCNEFDVIASGVAPARALVWAGTVSTPSEVKETTVASVAWRTRVLAIVLLPTCTLTSTAVAMTVVSGARATIGAAACAGGR
jgi:hypothetical protein